MALTEAERQACLVEIGQLLAKDFHVDFQNHYSIAIATCGAHPEQVNNELRNMLTHMARAIDADSAANVAVEMGKAKGHLETASRDCLKLANLFIFDELRKDSFYIQMRDGTISMALRMRLMAIETNLVEARKIEVNGSPQTIASLLDVNADLQELRKDYVHAFVTPGWTPTNWQATKLWLAMNWKGIVLGIVIGLLTNVVWIAGSAVYDHFHPVPQATK